MSTRVIEVAAGLIFRGTKLLITRRPAGAHLAGLWEFPGGKLEPGETWESALARELQEELGIDVEVGRCFAEARHPYEDRIIHLRFFVCRIVRGQPAPIGCPELAWAGASDLGQYAFPPADQELLTTLRAIKEFSASEGESF